MIATVLPIPIILNPTKEAEPDNSRTSATRKVHV